MKFPYLKLLSYSVGISLLQGGGRGGGGWEGYSHDNLLQEGKKEKRERKKESLESQIKQ